MHKPKSEFKTPHIREENGVFADWYNSLTWGSFLSWTSSWLIALLVSGIGAVALMLFLPHLSLGLFLAIFIGFTVLGSLPERRVYSKYIKSFFRHLFSGEIFEFYNIIKSIFIFIPLALVAGFGFTALTFSHMITFLAMLGITSGMLPVLLPWFVAIAGATLFGIIMYEMLRKAICLKTYHNIRKKISNLLFRKDWSQLKTSEKIKHVAKAIFIVLSIVMIVAISIVAIAFTQAEWLESMGVFLAQGLHLSMNFLQQIMTLSISIIVGHLTFLFLLQNSLKTASKIFSLQWQSIKENIAWTFQSDENFISAVYLLFTSIIPLIIHIICNGGVAAEGVLAVSGNVPHAVMMGATSAASEGLTDLHAAHGYQKEYLYQIIIRMWKFLKGALMSNSHQQNNLTKNADTDNVEIELNTINPQEKYSQDDLNIDYRQKIPDTTSSSRSSGSSPYTRREFQRSNSFDNSLPRESYNRNIGERSSCKMPSTYNHVPSFTQNPSGPTKHSQ